MSQLHRITADIGQRAGRPCIRGLRVRVKDILELLAAGARPEEIVADYPYLEAEDIVAALEFAADPRLPRRPSSSSASSPRILGPLTGRREDGS